MTSGFSTFFSFRGNVGVHPQLLLLLLSSESASGDRQLFLFAPRRSSHLHRPRGEDALADAHPQRLRHNQRRARPAPLAGSTPPALLDWGVGQEPSDGGQGAHRVSGRRLVTTVSTLLPDWLQGRVSE